MSRRAASTSPEAKAPILYPAGYRPGQGRHSGRRPPPPRQPRSPKEPLAFHRVDARGRRHWTPFALLTLGLALLVLASVAAIAVIRISQTLDHNAGLASGEAIPGTETATAAQTLPTVQWPGARLENAVFAPDAAARVKADFVAAWNWYYASDRLPDVAEAEHYFTGGYLEAVKSGLGYYAQNGSYAYWDVEKIEWTGAVEFSPDGSRATVKARLPGPFDIHEMDALRPGIQLQTITRPTWVTTVSLVWDSHLERWLAYHEVSGESEAGG